MEIYMLQKLWKYIWTLMSAQWNNKNKQYVEEKIHTTIGYFVALNFETDLHLQIYFTNTYFSTIFYVLKPWV